MSPLRWRACGEEREIAAQNDVRSETVNLDGLFLIGQVGDERFQRGFCPAPPGADREWPAPCLTRAVAPVLEEICRNHCTRPAVSVFKRT